jgi:hypothetical protein
MRPSSLPIRFCSIVGLLAVTVPVVRAEPGLVSPSPFLAAGSEPSAPAAAGGPIEFHGYMVLAGGERFSIYDTAKKKASWVGLNEKGNTFVVRSYRVVAGKTDQITVEYQGNTLVLSLKEGKTTAIAAPAAPILGRPIVPTVVAPAVQTTPPNLPAGASLEEWAAEVQRRRALRQQNAAAPDTPPPGSGQPAPQGEAQPSAP